MLSKVSANGANFYNNFIIITIRISYKRHLATNSRTFYSAAGRTWSDAEQSPALSDDECSGGGAALAPAALLARARALRRRGLVAEYEEIRARPPAGTFHHAK